MGRRKDTGTAAADRTSPGPEQADVQQPPAGPGEEGSGAQQSAPDPDQSPSAPAGEPTGGDPGDPAAGPDPDGAGDGDDTGDGTDPDAPAGADDGDDQEQARAAALAALLAGNPDVQVGPTPTTGAPTAITPTGAILPGWTTGSRSSLRRPDSRPASPAPSATPTAGRSCYSTRPCSASSGPCSTTTCGP